MQISCDAVFIFCRCIKREVHKVSTVGTDGQSSRITVWNWCKSGCLSATIK